MNAEPTNLTTVSDADLALVELELERTPQPRSTKDLAGKLAFEKTATERTQDVKKYDPDARFEGGDLIEKEYCEPLTVGSKSVEHFEGRVILKVVAKSFSKHFSCDMLEVDYPGCGVFRKYILVVTDGENTSGRSPDGIARDIFAKSEGAVQIYFVAFDTSPEKFAFLKDVGGDVLGAGTGGELRSALEQVYQGKILAEALDAGEKEPTKK